MAIATPLLPAPLTGSVHLAQPLPDDPYRLFVDAHGAGVTVRLTGSVHPDPQTGRPVYQRSWYGGTIENLERALRGCPETRFIGHAPGFWRGISGDAAADPSVYPAGPVREGGRLAPLFEQYPNLYADLSAGSALGALKRDPAHARAFLCRFSDRLLFGRDYYGGDLLQFLQTLDLPTDVQERIFGANARRLLSPADR